MYFLTSQATRNAFLTQGFLPSGFAKLVQGERKSKYCLDYSKPQPNFFLQSKIKIEIIFYLQ